MEPRSPASAETDGVADESGEKDEKVAAMRATSGATRTTPLPAARTAGSESPGATSAGEPEAASAASSAARTRILSDRGTAVVAAAAAAAVVAAAAAAWAAARVRACERSCDLTTRARANNFARCAPGDAQLAPRSRGA